MANLRPFKTFQPFNRFATFKTLVVSEAGMRPVPTGKSKRRERKTARAMRASNGGEQWGRVLLLTLPVDDPRQADDPLNSSKDNR